MSNMPTAAAMPREAAGSGSAWSWRRQTFEVPCTIDIENSIDSLHAYVELDGYDAGPGDEVIVHGAPTTLDPGQRIVIQGRATVIRAGLLDRLQAKLGGYLELTELYEVSFSEGRAA
jgi:hypothetical protein